MLPTTLLSLLFALLPALPASAQDCGIATATVTTFITIASGAPVATATGQPGTQQGVDPSVIPPFGVTRGVTLNDGTPRCAGIDNKPIECDCPPDFNNFLTAINSAVAGGAAFPSGTSTQDQLSRLDTCIVVLQSIKGGPGSGVGCPAVSTNWGELQNQLTSAVNGG